MLGGISLKFLVSVKLIQMIEVTKVDYEALKVDL